MLSTARSIAIQSAVSATRLRPHGHSRIHREIRQGRHQSVLFLSKRSVASSEFAQPEKQKTKKKGKKGKKKSKKNKNSKSLSIHILSANENQGHRKDDDLEQRRESSLQTSLDGYDEEDSEKKCYLSCWKPDLKTIGRCNLFWVIVFDFRQFDNSL